MKPRVVLYLVTVVLALAVAGVVYLAAGSLDVEVKMLTRDPYSAAKAPAYAGIASLFGSAIWLVSGASAVTTAVIARVGFGARIADEGPYRLVAFAGLLGLVMALDDQLLFHDAFARWVGIPEKLVHLTYAGSIFGILVYGRRQLEHTPWPLFLAALVCFGASSSIDLFVMGDGPLDQSEDVFKLGGVVFWAAYLLSSSWILTFDWCLARSTERRQPAAGDATDSEIPNSDGDKDGRAAPDHE